MDKSNKLFLSIKEFIVDLNNLFNSPNTSIQELNYLAKALTSKHFTPNKYSEITEPFTSFCKINEKSILDMDTKSLTDVTISLKSLNKASINIKNILHTQLGNENKETIYKHLQLLTTICNPSKDNKEAMKKQLEQAINTIENKQVVVHNQPPTELVNEFKDDNSKEGKFINNILKQTENINSSNPFELLANSGLMNADDDMDPEKLLLMLAKVAGKLKNKN